MAIPSRQIGWSTKSNLLWQISKQLENLTRVMYNRGTTTTTTTVSPTTSTTSTTTTVAPTTTTTTTVGGPSITVPSASNITSSSADFTFSFSPSDGTASQVGVALSTMPNPTRNSMPRNSTMNTTTSPNTLTVGPLDPSTLYYVRGFIQIGFDTYYSAETTITTPAS
jgi:hypothetical protein